MKRAQCCDQLHAVSTMFSLFVQRFLMQSAEAHNSRQAGGLVDTMTVEGAEVGDLDTFNGWLAKLLQTHGERIYRLKGFVAVKNEPRRLVCQVMFSDEHVFAVD